MPLFQNESKCETILIKKMTLIDMKMKLHAEFIFIIYIDLGQPKSVAPRPGF